MIQITDLHKSFSDKKILKGIDLSLKKGNVHIIYGKNGEGKSTLLKCVCGLLKPNQGKIVFTDIDKNNIGLILDNTLLIQKLKVAEYLKFICELKKVDKTKYVDQINKLLIVLDFDNERNTLISKLSKGTKSKLALAAALVYTPEVLILDEPFTGMDLKALDQAVKLLRQRADQGSTILISTHQAELLPSFMDEISVLKEGQIKFTLDAKKMNDEIDSQGKSSISEYLKDKI